MITLFINYFIFLFIAVFNGKIILELFNSNVKKLNIFEQSIFGLIITAFIAQIINFFLPLNNLIIYLNIIIIFIYIILNFKKVKNLNSLFSYISIALFFLTLLSIYGSSFSDDLSHYHHGSIANSDTRNYIVGMNSLHSLYGFSSIWLTLHSYLNFDYSRLQDIHVLNAIILFLFLNFLSYELIHEIKKKEKTVYLPVLFFSLIFVLAKYTRLKEFGIDRSAFLIFFYIILFYIKHISLDLNKKNTDEFKIFIFFLLSFFCTFLFFIKIIFIFSLILPISIFFHIEKKILILKNFLTYFLCLIYVSYFFKNFLISGCLVYPIEQLCFVKLPWYEATLIKDLNFNTEVFNKSFFQYDGDLKQSDYIQNFYWIKTWFQRNINELVEFFTILSSIFIMTILNFKRSINKYQDKQAINLYSLIIILILSFLLIFLKAPVIRMSHHVFILFFFVILLKYFNGQIIVNKKKVFISLILIAFIFNISKNLIRIKASDFTNDPIKILQKSGLYSEAIERKLGDFVYYQGWIGGYPIGNSNLENYNYKKLFIFDIITKKNN